MTMKIEKSIKEISHFLSEKGIKPSYQRVKILERLLADKSHPTVNDMYADLIDEIPSLSKTTVYNTLNIFVENEIVKSFSIDGNESRYDLNSHSHGHFICLSCKSIYDFDIDNSEIKVNNLEGFEMLQSEITIRGICKLCNDNKS